MTVRISRICVIVFVLLCWLGTAFPATALSDASHPAIAVMSPGGSSVFSFSGKRPTGLGVTDGKLAPCPSSPNCVSSQIPTTDAEHSIAPLAFHSTPAEAIAQVKAIVEAMPRTTVVQSTDHYLYAEFKSALMGFVDDVEFYLDPAASVIQVRSASRLGESDLGVNRQRIEAIRERLESE